MNRLKIEVDGVVIGEASSIGPDVDKFVNVVIPEISTREKSGTAEVTVPRSVYELWRTEVLSSQYLTARPTITRVSAKEANAEVRAWLEQHGEVNGDSFVVDNQDVGDLLDLLY